MTYLIAEIGTNHNGKPEIALELVDRAIDSGVDAVKMSLIEADYIALKSFPQWERFKSLELPDDVFNEARSMVSNADIDLIIAPFGVELVEKAARWADMLKIASGELTNNALLKACYDIGIPAILSTGMAALEEVQQAVDILNPDVIMHCVSLYPTQAQYANLRRISDLRLMFPDRDIGYSDHSTSILPCLIARTLGAMYIEKHFRTPQLNCVDEPISASPEEMATLRNQLMTVGNMLELSYKADFSNRAKLRRGPSGLRGDYQEEI